MKIHAHKLIVLYSSEIKDDGTFKTSFHVILDGKKFENFQKLELFVKLHLEELCKNSALGLVKSIWN